MAVSAGGRRERTVLYRLSDNDIGVTRKDPTKPGKYRPGYEEAMRLVDARAVDAVLCFKWDWFIREPLDLEYLIRAFRAVDGGGDRCRIEQVEFGSGEHLQVWRYSRRLLAGAIVEGSASAFATISSSCAAWADLRDRRARRA